MTRTIRSFAAAAIMAFVIAGGLVAVTTTSAVACDQATEDCDSGDTDNGGNGGDDTSSGNKNAAINTGGSSCSVYANGGGMGMYCVTLGGGNLKTLRERFGDQKLQQCRYSDLPKTVEPPYNANPDKGRFMLMTCLGSIDFDTYSGGPDRTVAISIVFVPFDADISDHHNGITDFLWNRFKTDALMPVPFMVTRPNVTPIVGTPTFFTFRWLDPVTKDVVAQGDYANRENGGPFRRIVEGDVAMEARATKIVIDPRQTDIKPETCDPEASYLPGVLPRSQPANACKITFKRSSASARKYANREIPGRIKDAFYADVIVTWKVTYGPVNGPMRTLGNDFTMRMRQVLPVQEVQAPNQPPAVVY
ncbi:hypothetical protein [Aeromicrobium sp. 9AM]|uniref:hypothetical protein n=1 Tax=Aeromicrobium sp. 9AM TaxID=2653126 RepID=UPI0012F3810B|nr:hypothetical protein [Aeromicrobium sp. 9AM]VXC43201.1 conserved exported hypothetical protein [Aeromicrobium sp. 9AM]